MSNFFDEFHRNLQDEFGTRRMADRIVEHASSAAIRPHEKAFIESRDMFFLATVDAAGRPTVSYKGGAPGFVQVIDESTLIFPSYDGNGMYLSMGNIASCSEIGLLLMDFEKPHRMRVQGRAELSRDPDLLGRYKEAELVVKVAVRVLFMNCPRYVHRYQKVQASRYVPRPDCDTPLATWKRIDEIQEVLPQRDLVRVEAAGGPLSEEEWIGKIQAGAPDA